MIDLYSWPTPNGYKISIALEEMGLPYRIVPINIREGAQFAPDFLKISPNNKIPAIVDNDGPDAPFELFESGAILLYLAEKSGQFLPTDNVGRFRTLAWLMFQSAGVGPMLGQTHHFRNYAPEPIQYAIDRYTNEAQRLYSVMDRRLAEVEYFAGPYTVADMAVFPWVRMHDRQAQDLKDFPNVKRWLDAVAARPAVQRGVAVLSEQISHSPFTQAQRKTLFG